MKIAWSHKKNKVRPKNKDKVSESITDDVYAGEEEEEEVEDEIEDEQEDDINDNDTGNIPHTDVPNIIMVREDDDTKKIVNDDNDGNYGTIINDGSDFDNKKNENLAAGKQFAGSSTMNFKSSNAQQSKEESKKQPEIEVINAAEVVSNGPKNGSITPKQAFEQIQISGQKENNNSETLEKPKAKVAFADPTLSIPDQISPITPKNSSQKAPETGEMTPSSLPPDDTSVNTKKVPESKQEIKQASPVKSIPKNDPIPNLESDPVFMEIEQTIKAKPDEAKSVNSIYVFVIKCDGKPVKRWILDLRSSPGTMSCGSPEENIAISPDCSIICDDKDFFKLASGQMNPQKAILTGKLKVRGNFLLLQKLQSIF